MSSIRLDNTVVNSLASTLLFWGIQQNQKDFVSNIVTMQPVIANAVSPEGETPLILASRYQHKNLMESLLEAGALVNSTDNKGRTALIWCTHDVEVEYDPWATEVWEYDGLMVQPIPSPKPCNVECVELLMKWGASVHYTIKKVNTHITTSTGDLKRVLLHGKGLVTTALLPAVRAKCCQCTKLFAMTGTVEYHNRIERQRLMGMGSPEEIQTILRNSLTYYQDKSTLKGLCKTHIRKVLMKLSGSGLYTTVAELPLPEPLKDEILTVEKESKNEMSFLWFTEEMLT